MLNLCANHIRNPAKRAVHGKPLPGSAKPPKAWPRPRHGIPRYLRPDSAIPLRRLRCSRAAHGKLLPRLGQTTYNLRPKPVPGTAFPDTSDPIQQYPSDNYVPGTALSDPLLKRIHLEKPTRRAALPLRAQTPTRGRRRRPPPHHPARPQPRRHLPHRQGPPEVHRNRQEAVRQIPTATFSLTALWTTTYT